MSRFSVSVSFIHAQYRKRPCRELQCLSTTLTVLLALLLFCVPANACILRAERDLQDIKYADVVVIGRVSNYTIIRDEDRRQKFRDVLLQQLSRNDLTPEERKFNENMLSNYNGASSMLSDYARFDIDIQEVLSGKAENVITVIWDNSTFGEPKEIESGLYLIGLRWPTFRLPPLRGPTATVSPSREPQRLTVLQAPCANPFIFKAESKDAVKVREILGAN